MENYEKRSGGGYSKEVLELIVTTWKDIGRQGRNWRRKLQRYGQLPPEVDTLFAQLEQMGQSINSMPPEQLRTLLERHLRLIDRGHDLDQKIVELVGWAETINWRLGRQVSEETVHKIEQLFRQDVIPQRLPTPQEARGSRVAFRPSVDYHDEPRQRSDRREEDSNS
jgi:hypothetical protein